MEMWRAKLAKGINCNMDAYANNKDGLWVHHFYLLTKVCYSFKPSSDDQMRNEGEDNYQEKFVFKGDKWQHFMTWDDEMGELEWIHGQSQKPIYNLRGYW